MFKHILFAAMITSWMTATTVSAQAPDRKAQATEHFQKGSALYSAGQYLQAIKEFKEAYRLIPKPIILLYIADIYREAGLNDESITYYRKFLEEARMDDPGRPKAETALKEMGVSATAPVEVTPTPNETPVQPVEKPQPAEKPAKPRKAFKPGELIHTPLEEAQPNHPAKLEVELPDDIKRAWVYLYYRTQGQDEYVKVKFKVDKDDVYYYILPCSVMKGNILQYYIEAVGVSGRKVAGSATAASPYIVDINASNPLQPGGQMSCAEAEGGKGTPAGGEVIAGPSSGGSQGGGEPVKRRPKVFYIALGTSVATGAMVGLSVLFGTLASTNAANLENNQMMPGGNLVVFEKDVANYEKSGKGYQNTMYITTGLSMVLALASGYLWADYFGKIPVGISINARLEGTPAPAAPAPATPASDSGEVFVTPLVGEGFLGLGGTIRF